MMDDIPREDELVRILSRAPDVLLPGLTFIGREISLRGQIVDLVGVDREGRLCIFEVKRAIESLAGPWQLVKYAAAFESLNDDDLVRLLTEQSGGLNLEETGNFDNWYRERPFEKGISSARPVRLYLVVIGEDETDVANDRATVDAFVFLAERGIDLSLVFVPIADLYAAVNPATFGISDRMHVEPGRGGIQTQSNVIVEPPSRQYYPKNARCCGKRTGSGTDGEPRNSHSTEAVGVE